jgi:FkbM family methyltransferase
MSDTRNETNYRSGVQREPRRDWSAPVPGYVQVGEKYYRFSARIGWFVHIWKALTRQDHGQWRQVLARHTPRNGVAIDVGAHGGQFTRLLSGLTPEGLVIAVEPSSYARSILRTALWLRGARNVIVVAAGLGNKAGSAMIRTPVKRRGDMGYGLATLSALPRESVVEPIAVVTLDGLVRSLDLPALHLIKADIEGAEAALIAGATDTLKKYRPALILEMSDPLLKRSGSSLAALWEQVVALGYRPYRLRGTGGELVPCPGEPIDGDIVWLPDRVADSA